MDWTVARIVDRLEALASNARERQRSHQADQTAWHYEHGVGDAYAFAARMVSEFAQGGTVAQPPEVVPFSSPDQNRMNAAQADYPLEAFKKEFHASLAAGEPTGRAQQEAPSELADLARRLDLLLDLVQKEVKGNPTLTSQLVSQTGSLLDLRLLLLRHKGDGGPKSA